MTDKPSIYGLADALGNLFEAPKIERPEPVRGPRPPTQPILFGPGKPAIGIVGEAREIVATIFEDEGTDIARRCAVIAREGGYDDDNEMKIALAALRRGVVIGSGR